MKNEEFLNEEEQEKYYQLAQQICNEAYTLTNSLATHESEIGTVKRSVVEDNLLDIENSLKSLHALQSMIN